MAKIVPHKIHEALFFAVVYDVFLKTKGAKVCHRSKSSLSKAVSLYTPFADRVKTD
jgi:hypothetical protein